MGGDPTRTNRHDNGGRQGGAAAGRRIDLDCQHSGQDARSPKRKEKEAIGEWTELATDMTVVFRFGLLMSEVLHGYVGEPAAVEEVLVRLDMIGKRSIVMRRKE